MKKLSDFILLLLLMAVAPSALGQNFQGWTKKEVIAYVNSKPYYGIPGVGPGKAAGDEYITFDQTNLKWKCNHTVYLSGKGHSVLIHKIIAEIQLANYFIEHFNDSMTKAGKLKWHDYVNECTWKLEYDETGFFTVWNIKGYA